MRIEKLDVEQSAVSSITLQVRRLDTGAVAQVWRDYPRGQLARFEADARRFTELAESGEPVDWTIPAEWTVYAWMPPGEGRGLFEPDGA